MSTEAPPPQEFVTRTFRAIGTTATVVVQEQSIADCAEEILRTEIDAIDRACSRFRPDSELEYLHANSGQSLRVSSLLFESLEVAYAVAEQTQGAVDPTVGNAMARLGYDRDFDQLEPLPSPPVVFGPVAGFRHLELNRRSRTVRIPRGVRLDLGASAKALVADRSADHIADKTRAGVLVSIGGDVAASGPAPAKGWPIGIAQSSSTPLDDVDEVVAIRGGGLASSSTGVRTWMAGTNRIHHIVDPSSGNCATPYWTLVSATGSTCVDANALSTAALVWGSHALDLLPTFGRAVRLVRHDGMVVTVGPWPQAHRT